MNEPLKPSRLMIKFIPLTAALIIIIGIIYYRSLAAVPFSLGVLATSALNILKVRMLEKTVQKVVDMDDQDAGKNVVRFQYLFRYFLTGVVLAAVGLIHTFTTPPAIYSSRELYINVWGTLFPNAPEALLTAPFISIWGALAGIFTLQLAVIIVRSFKLEKDGTEFIKYEDDNENADETDDNTDDNSDEKNDKDITTNTE